MRQWTNFEYFRYLVNKNVFILFLDYFPEGLCSLEEKVSP